MSNIDLAAVGNHLWQSTLFALAAGGFTLLLRRNPARARYLLWLSASLKFLVPFSLLTAAGALIPWSPAPVHDARPAFLESAVHLATPVTQWVGVPDAVDLKNDLPQVAITTTSGNLALIAAGIVWALGTLVVTLRWLARWRVVQRALRESTPADLGFDIPVRASSYQLEPGVLGVLRPVLLLPRGLDERLTPEQLRAVLAHERCHVVWRDNLGAVLHMVVEAVFWFHPFVWWLGTRLIAERERACDEQVLAEGHAPESYAEGVLKVCEHFLNSRLPCVSGISGADLKQRIRVIMRNGLIRKLSSLQKAMLAAAALLAIIAPVATGLLNSPPALAQAAQTLPTVPTQAPAMPPTAPAQPAVASPAVPAQATSTRQPAWQRPLTFWDAPPTHHRQYGSVSVQPDGILIQNIPLHYLIAEAYGVTASRLEGIGYEDSAVPLCCKAYGIKTEGATLVGDPHERISYEPTIPDQYRPALQAFLAKEFGLVVRRSKQQVEGYVMTVGPGGAKLKPASGPPEIFHFCIPGCILSPPGIAGLGVEVAGYSPREFAAILAKSVYAPIVDETGLQGRYHFDAWLPRDGSPPRDVKPAEIFAKMEAQLGLHVEARRVTVDVIEVVSLKEPGSGN